MSFFGRIKNLWELSQYSPKSEHITTTDGREVSIGVLKVNTAPSNKKAIIIDMQKKEDFFPVKKELL